MLQTLISILATALFTVLLLALYIRKRLPIILEDVALGVSDSIQNSLQETFENPNIKRAMSILGTKSGEVRADTALRSKAANAIVEMSPVIAKVLETIGLTPLEGLRLMNDPLFGPTIQGMIQSFMGGQKPGSISGHNYGGKM